MSQAGFTPIQHYRTTTASTAPIAGNLAAGELAINTTDEKLYFKNTAGVVKLLASTASSTATVSSVDVSGGTTGLTTSGGPITTSGTITLAGTLVVSNGGTGVSTLTGIAKGNGTSAFTAAVAGTDFAAPTPSNTYVLTGNGAGGFSNAPAPTAGYVLGWNGSSYNWVVAPAAINAISLAGGTAGVVPYQTAPDTTSFTLAGVAGQILTSNGTGAPTWAATPGALGNILTSNGAGAWVSQAPAVTGPSTAKVYYMAQF